MLVIGMRVLLFVLVLMSYLVSEVSVFSLKGSSIQVKAIDPEFFGDQPTDYLKDNVFSGDPRGVLSCQMIRGSSHEEMNLRVRHVIKKYCQDQVSLEYIKDGQVTVIQNAAQIIRPDRDSSTHLPKRKFFTHLKTKPTMGYTRLCCHLK